MALDDRDPSTLTDEELDALINGDEPDEELDAPSDEEDAPEEDEKPDAADKLADEPEDTPADEPSPEDSEEEEEKPPSRREQLRIQQLLAKGRKPETKPATVDLGLLKYEDELEADPELIERLEADRKKAQDSATADIQRQLQSSEWRTRLDIDAPQIESKYDFLNRNDKEKFHPVLADSLNSWYLDMVGFDPETKTVEKPGIRYAEFIDGMYELAEEIAATKVEKATREIKSQVARTGLRPDGSSAKRLNLNQAPQDMTDEELDAVIASAIPSR